MFNFFLSPCGVIKNFLDVDNYDDVDNHPIYVCHNVIVRSEMIAVF